MLKSKVQALNSGYFDNDMRQQSDVYGAGEFIFEESKSIMYDGSAHHDVSEFMDH